jgi:uncharacterized phage protein (TIGR01671 family)
MEDRYLSKAKRISDGEWVVGYLYRLSENNPPFLMLRKYGESYEVDEHTICQCTGSRDKNSKLIYDNDIAKDEKGNLYKAFWQKNYYQYSWICIKSNYLPVGAQWNLWSIKSFEIEVIGNVFDNKDLLESEG